MSKTRVPAVEGWFTMDDEPRLVASRGMQSGSYFVPKALAVSGNPAWPGEEREDVLLGRRGTVWSYATNHYQPPEPYVSPEPFVPYTVIAVELPDEQMVVLGQLADGVDPATISLGTEVELVLGPLYEDHEYEYVMWKWRPVESTAEVAEAGR